MDGPVLLCGALAQQDVLHRVHQQHIARHTWRGAAVLKEHRLVQHPLGVKVAQASLRVPQELGGLAALDGQIGQLLLQIGVHEPDKPIPVAGHGPGLHLNGVVSEECAGRLAGLLGH